MSQHVELFYVPGVRFSLPGWLCSFHALLEHRKLAEPNRNWHCRIARVNLDFSAIG
jgi:hypothetical protein